MKLLKIPRTLALTFGSHYVELQTSYKHHRTGTSSSILACQNVVLF